jgi:beta-galactosidase/beta-glucuronidase
MVERDKKHASVTVWSMGNEAGDGGIQTWGARPLPHYRLPADREYEYAFVVMPHGF